MLDVTKFLPDHPGGALAIVTFAGKDASEEFNMIHPPDVIQKYFPEGVIGVLGDKPTESSAGGAAAPLLTKNKGDPMANEQAWGNWREEGKADNPGTGIIFVMYGCMHGGKELCLQAV